MASGGSVDTKFCESMTGTFVVIYIDSLCSGQLSLCKSAVPYAKGLSYAPQRLAIKTGNVQSRPKLRVSHKE